MRRTQKRSSTPTLRTSLSPQGSSRFVLLCHHPLPQPPLNYILPSFTSHVTDRHLIIISLYVGSPNRRRRCRVNVWIRSRPFYLHFLRFITSCHVCCPLVPSSSSCMYAFAMPCRGWRSLASKRNTKQRKSEESSGSGHRPEIWRRS